MSSSNALASLITNYTDSENEDVDNTDISSDHEEVDNAHLPSENENVDNTYSPSEVEPKNNCSKKLQDRVTYLHNQMLNGLDINEMIRNKKEFNNPCMYEKFILHCNLDEFGTNYEPEIYNPKIWGKESYYDELSKVQNAELEKIDKEQKAKTKAEIVSGTSKKAKLTNGSASSSVLIPSLNGKKRKSRWDFSH